MKDKIAIWYEKGLWTKGMVKEAVPRLITPEEYEEIIGEPYVDPEEVEDYEDE